jgi:cytochrome c556
VLIKIDRKLGIQHQGRSLRLQRFAELGERRVALGYRPTIDFIPVPTARNNAGHPAVVTFSDYILRAHFMSQKVKQIGWATWPVLVLVLAASVVGSGATRAESIIPALHATMPTMRASLAQIGEFAKGDGEQAAALDAATKVVTFAKSIPAIFPPGSELTDLPSKSGAAPTTWDDVDRFLDAQKHLVIETSKLLAAVNDGNREAIGQQLATTRRVCSACHEQFRE